MRLTLALIRCGATQSGMEGRQPGPLDEPLLETERSRLHRLAEQGHYPSVELAYVSPMLRCRETMSIIFPRTIAVVINSLRAFDAGDFSAKTHGELLREDSFTEWAESEQIPPCPGGDDLNGYTIRCNRAFRSLTDELISKGVNMAAIVTHSLAVSTIMQRYCIPRSNYRNWSPGWGGGYVVEYDDMNQSMIVRSKL